MRRILFLVAALALVAGCKTTQTAPPTAAKELEIFRDGQRPNRPYTEVRVLSDDGRLEEEGEIENKFIKKASHMKADGLIIHPKAQSGYEGRPFVPFGGVAMTFLYKASIIKYTSAASQN